MLIARRKAQAHAPRLATVAAREQRHVVKASRGGTAGSTDGATDATTTPVRGGRPATDATGEDTANDRDAWARLACSDARCIVVAGYENDDMRGGSRGCHVSAPFVLADPAPPIPAELCAGRRLLSLVAGASTVSTSGERLAAALRKAGCLVRGPDAARAARSAPVIYARAVDDAAAVSMARALHAEIAPLSWESPSEIVIALGGG